ncbi:small acid-soluble spore protein O [Bacillus andreraoultii]|uniref:small acid-soluble spore protein O n=1 Tax=Bacillus andreraoultii TaxID=1499685 RepID=UPI000539E22F|nr:small acid-soluble spore protein O [Bacillus andreraoultii]
MSENQKIKDQLRKYFSDKQAVKDEQPHEFDHELANEPLTASERLNNKKTKKRQ